MSHLLCKNISNQCELWMIYFLSFFKCQMSILSQILRWAIDLKSYSKKINRILRSKSIILQMKKANYFICSWFLWFGPQNVMIFLCDIRGELLSHSLHSIEFEFRIHFSLLLQNKGMKTKKWNEIIFVYLLECVTK